MSTWKCKNCFLIIDNCINGNQDTCPNCGNTEGCEEYALQESEILWEKQIKKEISLTHYEQCIRDIVAKHFKEFKMEHLEGVGDIPYIEFHDEKAFDADVYKLLNDFTLDIDKTYIEPHIKLIAELLTCSKKAITYLNTLPEISKHPDIQNLNKIILTFTKLIEIKK